MHGLFTSALVMLVLVCGLLQLVSCAVLPDSPVIGLHLQEGRESRGTGSRDDLTEPLYQSENKVYLLANQTSYLECGSYNEGEAVLLVQWFRGDDELLRYTSLLSDTNYTLSDRYSFAASYNLVIQQVTPTDRGDYKCRVIVRATGQPRLHSVNVMVLDFVSLADEPIASQERNLAPGASDEILYCPVSEGDGEVDGTRGIYWAVGYGPNAPTALIGGRFADGEVVVVSEQQGRYEILSNSAIVVHSVEESTWRFWCLISNGPSSSSGYVDVTVSAVYIPSCGPEGCVTVSPSGGSNDDNEKTLAILLPCSLIVVALLVAIVIFLALRSRCGQKPEKELSDIEDVQDVPESTSQRDSYASKYELPEEKRSAITGDVPNSSRQSDGGNQQLPSVVYTSHQVNNYILNHFRKPVKPWQQKKKPRPKGRPAVKKGSTSGMGNDVVMDPLLPADGLRPTPNSNEDKAQHQGQGVSGLLLQPRYSSPSTVDPMLPANLPIEPHNATNPESKPTVAQGNDVVMDPLLPADGLRPTPNSNEDKAQHQGQGVSGLLLQPRYSSPSTVDPMLPANLPIEPHNATNPESKPTVAQESARQDIPKDGQARREGVTKCKEQAKERRPIKNARQSKARQANFDKRRNLNESDCEDDIVTTSQGPGSNVVKETDGGKVAMEIYCSSVVKETDDGKVAKEIYGSKVVKETDDGKIVKEIYGSKVVKETDDGKVAKEIYCSNVVKETDDGKVTKEIYCSNVVKETDGGQVAKETDGCQVAKKTDGGQVAKETDGGKVAKETDVGQVAKKTDGGKVARKTDGSEVIKETDIDKVAKETENAVPFEMPTEEPLEIVPTLGDSEVQEVYPDVPRQTPATVTTSPEQQKQSRELEKQPSSAFIPPRREVDQAASQIPPTPMPTHDVEGSHIDTTLPSIPPVYNQPIEGAALAHQVDNETTGHVNGTWTPTDVNPAIPGVRVQTAPGNLQEDVDMVSDDGNTDEEMAIDDVTEEPQDIEMDVEEMVLAEQNENQQLKQNKNQKRKITPTKKEKKPSPYSRPGPSKNKIKSKEGLLSPV